MIVFGSFGSSRVFKGFFVLEIKKKCIVEIGFVIYLIVFLKF